MFDSRPRNFHRPDNLRSDNDDLAVGAVFAFMRRGRTTILLTVLAAICVGIVYIYAIARPSYTSTTVIMLETREERVLDFQSVIGGLSGDTSVVNSEVEVLRSRGLLQKVVIQLGLTNDPEFNPNLRLSGMSAQSVRNMLEFWKTPATTADIVARYGDRNHIDTAINELLERLNIQNVRQSLVFRITVDSEVPEKAALIADTLAQAYVQNQLDVKLEATSQATSWLSRRVAELKSELETAESAVTAFNSATDLIDPATLRAKERQLKELRERLAGSRGDQQVALATSTASLETMIERQSRDLILLQQLMREAEASRLLYEYFLGRLKETAAQQGIQQADSRVLSGAVVADSPTQPRGFLVLCFSAMAGLGVGIAYSVLKELQQVRFRTGRELEEFTRIRVLGQIPLLPKKARQDAIGFFASNPTSGATEAIRNLRTSVLLSKKDAPPQVIVTTSALPGDGKTTLSLALAHNLTEMGDRVLFVQGDIRRHFTRMNWTDADGGALISVVSGAANLSDAVTRDPVTGADFLAGEPSQRNPADIFSSDGFGRLLADAKEQYDTIIIDTPPVLAVPDARVIGQSADALLFCVKWDATTQSQVEEALTLIEAVNITVTGLVLTQIDPAAQKRYGYGPPLGGYAEYGHS